VHVEREADSDPLKPEAKATGESTTLANSAIEQVVSAMGERIERLEPVFQRESLATSAV